MIYNLGFRHDHRNRQNMILVIKSWDYGLWSWVDALWYVVMNSLDMDRKGAGPPCKFNKLPRCLRCLETKMRTGSNFAHS